MKLTAILALAATALAGETINNEARHCPQPLRACARACTCIRMVANKITAPQDRSRNCSRLQAPYCRRRQNPRPLYVLRGTSTMATSPFVSSLNTHRLLSSQTHANIPQTAAPSNPTAPSSTPPTTAASPSASRSAAARSSRAGTRVCSTCALARRGS